YLRLGNPIGSAKETEIFVDRQIRIKAELLRHITKLRSDAESLPPNITAADRALAEGGFYQTAKHPDRSRLSGAICTEKSEDLAGLDRHRDSIGGDLLPEFLREILEDNKRLRHRISERSLPLLIFCRSIAQTALSRQNFAVIPMRALQKAPCIPPPGKTGSHPARMHRVI